MIGFTAQENVVRIMRIEWATAIRARWGPRRATMHYYCADKYVFFLRAVALAAWTSPVRNR